MYPTRNHETTFPGTTEPHVLGWFGGLPSREKDPVRVSYTAVRGLQPPAGGTAYDGAYWVSDMVLAPDAAQGRVDAARTTQTDAVAVLPAQPGVDLLGPFRLSGADVTPAPAEPDLLELRLAGVSALTVDAERLDWSHGRRRVVGTTDVAAEVLLLGVRNGDVRVTGADVRPDPRGLRLQVPAGAFEVALEPRR
jgi:hypothetical protein